MSSAISPIRDDRSEPSPWGPYAAAIAILLTGGAVYFDSFHGPFVFDDLPTIVQNETVHSLRPLSAVLSPPAATTTAGRPLANLTLAVNYALTGFDVVSYHAVNLGIHLLAALTLFGVLRRSFLICGPRLKEKSTPLAAAAALIWAAHPLQTESVTYIAQRVESLVSLFYLLTLYAAIRAATGARPIRWQVVSVAACLAGMACKEVMVSAPLMVLLYDRIFLSRSFREIFSRRGAYYLALAATWALLFWLVYSAGTRDKSAGFGLPLGVGEYAVTQLVAIPHYLRLCFWPSPLVFDYGAEAVVEPSRVAPGAVAVLALIIATLVAMRFWPRLGFLGLSFFALLAPSSSIVPIATQTMAEHRMYLALACVVTLFVLAGDWLFDAAFRRLGPLWARRRLLAKTIATGAVVLILGVLTVERNNDYSSVLALWQDEVRKRPDLGRAHAALAGAYLYPGTLNATEAIKEATKAIELEPDVGVYLNRGHAYLLQERYDEALADFNRAIELHPDFGPSYYNRGSALLHLSRLDEAIADFDRAIELNAEFAPAYLQRGVSWFYLKRYDHAVRDFDRTIELEPHAADAYYNRARCRFAQRSYAQAWHDLAVSRELGQQVDPDFVEQLEKAILEAPAEMRDE